MLTGSSSEAILGNGRPGPVDDGLHASRDGDFGPLREPFGSGDCKSERDDGAQSSSKSKAYGNGACLTGLTGRHAFVGEAPSRTYRSASHRIGSTRFPSAASHDSTVCFVKSGPRGL